MKILITGGSGFIGSHLINHLLEKNEAIRIVSLDLVDVDINNDRVTHKQVDIRNYDELDRHLKGEEFDLCIHLAALCKEPGFGWNEYFETNYTATKNIIDCCKELGVDDIIFTSTMMVFKAEDERKEEHHLTAPDTAYGISKLLAEKELLNWKVENSKRNIKIIRPSVVFGKGENGNFTRLYKSLRSKFFPYVGRKTTVKSNIYVDELVYFIDFLIENNTDQDVYNFAFPEEYSMKRIIGDFKDVFGLKPITPVLPFKLMLLASYMFEFLNAIGIKNPIHHRRIEKLYNSTNIYPSAALNVGYKFKYDLKSSLKDWSNKCNGELY